MQARERQLRLRLNTPRTQDLHTRRPRSRRSEQRRLPDARLSTEDERSAARGPCGVEQIAQLAAFHVTPDQHEAILRRRAQSRKGAAPDSKTLTGGADTRM